MDRLQRENDPLHCTRGAAHFYADNVPVSNQVDFEWVELVGMETRARRTG